MAAPFDVERAALTRAAIPIVEGLARSDDTGNGANIWPQWSPDGQRITYRKRLVRRRFHMVDTGGRYRRTGASVRRVRCGEGRVESRRLLRRAAFYQKQVSRDILAIRPGVETAAIPLVATEAYSEQGPAISRDGRWLAYSSNETGRPEIFVRPFPDVDAGKWQISTGGGIQSVWAYNGRELFFANPETRELEAAEFNATSTTFQLVRVTTLFEIREDTHFDNSGLGNTDFYDVAPDDQRFLMARRYEEDEAETSFVLVLNFFEELKRLAGE